MTHPFPVFACVRLSVGAIVVLMTVFWLIVETLDYFGITILKGSGITIYYFVWFHAVAFGSFFGVTRSVRLHQIVMEQQIYRIKADDPDQTLSDELVGTIRSLHAKNEHVEVTRLGRVLSRPLWISGRYEQRIAIGNYFVDSAGRSGSIKDQSLGLIDDVGWTNAVVGNIESAKTNISHGINLATASDDWYLVAKGNRHLAVIQQKLLRDPSSAESLLASAEVAAAKIPGENDKDEMFAGIYFNRAEGALQSLDYVSALAIAQRALDIYTKLGDQTRKIKLQTLKAQIQLESGHTKEAADQFRYAHSEATTHSRRDEVGKSLLGLGECQMREGTLDLAEITLSEALTILREIGLKIEADKAESLLTNLRQQDKNSD